MLFRAAGGTSRSSYNDIKRNKNCANDGYFACLFCIIFVLLDYSGGARDAANIAGEVCRLPCNYYWFVYSVVVERTPPPPIRGGMRFLHFGKLLAFSNCVHSACSCAHKVQKADNGSHRYTQPAHMEMEKAFAHSCSLCYFYDFEKCISVSIQSAVHCALLRG